METLARLPSHLMKAFFCLLLFAGTVLSADTPSVEKKPAPSDESTPQNFFDENTGIDFVWVEGDCFRMGDPVDKNAPPHEVCVDGFWIGKTETTLEQWQNVMGNSPSGESGPQLPVTNVSWHDVDYFINKLRENTDRLYRLPSEAEWEFAARGGKNGGNLKYTGADKQADVAWCNDNEREQPSPVMSKQPNALGLFDMSGNVAEWCRDWFHSGYYLNSPREAPYGPAAGTLRTLRGGSWLGSDYECRVTTRDAYPPQSSHSSIGFRLIVPGKQRKAAFYDDVASMKFIWVEGGCFQMGSVLGRTDETPVRDVCVDGFWLGETEVTQAQWQKIMGNNPSTFVEPLQPVTNISWNDSMAYFRRLKNQAQRDYRFPTEAEWEYAARGGVFTNNSLYSGSKLANEVAWFSENTQQETAPVRQKKPNELGLYDMSGNVAEWCADWYRAEAYNSASKFNPKGPDVGLFRSLRGGHWCVGKDGCRVSSRANGSPSGSGAYIGLRVSLSGDQVDLSLVKQKLAKPEAGKAAPPVPATEVKVQEQPGANR